MSENSLIFRVESLIKNVTLTRQDVLELTECVIQEYLNQQRCELDSDDSDEEPISVNEDEEGDLIDEEGYIYDKDTHIRIGEKDLKTKKRNMYNIV